MSAKLSNVHGVSSTLSGKRSNIQNMVFGTVEDNANSSRVKYEEISLDSITPRSINQYSQSRIHRLVKSIRNTNNRLIHPIVVVKAADLPRDGEVIKRFIEEGVDVDKLEYIIVAGERRYRAFQKLREEENKAIEESGKFSRTNPFNTITANVLSKKEAANEAAFYEDSNVEARQLTPIEGILHIKAALDEVKTDEDKRNALIEMNQGSEAGIPEDPAKAARKFNTAKYCLYYLSAELGIDSWSPSTVKTYLSIINNCDSKVVDAIIAGEYAARNARDLTDLPIDKQLQLLDMYTSGDVDGYVAEIEKISAAKKKKQKNIRYTHKDAQRQIASAVKKLNKERTELSVIVDSLGAKDKEVALKALKEYDDFILKMDKFMQMLD